MAPFVLTDTIVNLVLGPELVGLVISYFLWGALTVQLYNYLNNFWGDRTHSRQWGLKGDMKGR